MAISPIHPGALGAYVYEIIVDDVVRYIGKGRGQRAASHVKIARRLLRNMQVGKKVRQSRFYRELAKAVERRADIQVRIVEGNLTDAAAFELEEYAIATAPGGQLWNTAPGGEGQSSEFLRALMADPQRRELHREKAKASWAANPDRRDARFAEPGSRERQSQMMREKWADPNYRAHQSSAHTKPRPHRRGAKVPALSAPAKARWADPAFRERAIEAMKAAWAADPEGRAATKRKLAEIRASPEYRAKLSASVKAAKARRKAAV